MIMTQELAQALLDNLACVAVSASGGVEVDENGEAIVSPEDLEFINTYARSKFVEICKEWEELMGEEWTIRKESPKPTSPICPHCSEELTLCALPEVDCTEDTVSVETEYECMECGKGYIFRTEGKVTEWSEPIIEEE